MSETFTFVLVVFGWGMLGGVCGAIVVHYLFEKLGS